MVIAIPPLGLWFIRLFSHIVSFLRLLAAVG
jgi:hypothetical protein